MQYVTEQGRACGPANGWDLRGKLRPESLSFQINWLPGLLFYRGVSICVVEEARPNPKAPLRGRFFFAATGR